MRPTILLIAASLCAHLCSAQQPEVPAQATQTPPPLPVLRVYANLVQIPVLVLSSTHEKLYTAIAPSRFQISFDNGQWFKATNVRREGDDPLDLAIVLDTRSPQQDILPKIDQAIAGLAPTLLQPHDHISIYVMSCDHVRSVFNVSGDSIQLKDAVDTALSDWTTRRLTKDKSPCSQNAPLWDLLAYATDNLSSKSGRRVILAFTSGDDNKSARTWDSLTAFAQNSGVTIFGLNPDPGTVSSLMSGPLLTGRGTSTIAATSTASTVAPANSFSAICELTGGLMLRAPSNTTPDNLKRAIQMVRDRYILDFPRPVNTTAGVHNLQVRIDRGSYYIRPAGNSVPVADPARQNDQQITPPPSPAPTQLAEASIPAPPQPIAETPAAQPAAPTPAQPTPAPQQQQPTPAPTPAAATPPPTIKVTTRLTIVDVTVTDKNNHPIHGLLKPDFTLKEDNKPQPIHDFTEYGADSTSKPPAPLPPNTYTNQLSATSAATNIILLDSVSTGLRTRLRASPQYFAYARSQSESFIRKMAPGTQVAILDMNSSIRIVQPLTADRDLLLRTLHDFKYHPVPGASLIVGRTIGEVCAVLNEQSRLNVQTLRQVAAYLAGIKGRKSLIWFTPGTPWLTNFPRYAGIPCLSDFTPDLQHAYTLLTAAQVALYPVDPQGLQTDVSDASSPAVVTTRSADQEISDQRDALRSMADATGGIAYTDRNDLDTAVAEAISTGSDYYSLSYTPPRPKQDNLYHSISVSVDRPAIRLQYSSGYSDGDLAKLKPADKNADPGLHLEMLHDALNTTQLTFTFSPQSIGPRPADAPLLGQPNPALKNPKFTRYTLHYTIEPSQITFTDDPDGTRHAVLQFDLIAYDIDGKALNTIRQQAKLTLHPGQTPAFLQKPFEAPIQFDVPANTTTLRAGIFDPTAQKSGTIELPLTPPKS